MSSADLLAGPVVQTILLFCSVVIAALLIVLALLIVAFFPFSARLAPVYRALGLHDPEWIALMRLSVRESERADVLVLEERFRRCVGLAVGTRRRRLRAISLYALGYALIQEARWDEAAACLQESLALARERSKPSDLVNALRGIAMLHGMRGDLEAGRPYLDEAASLLPGLRQRLAAALWLDIGWTASQHDRLDEAWRAWAIALQLATADPKGGTVARIARLNLAWTDLRTGQRQRGRSSLAQVLADANSAGDLTVEAHALTTLAAADWEEGDDDAGRARATTSLDILGRRHIRLHAGEAHSVLGLIEVRAGNTALAERHLAVAAPLVVTRNGRDNVARLLRQLGDEAAREGRIADARVRYERAWAIFDRWGSPELAAEVRAAETALPRD